MNTLAERESRRQAWHKANPVTPGKVEKAEIDIPDVQDQSSVQATPDVTRLRGILEWLGAGLTLLLFSPLIIGLAPIWIPLNWWMNRRYARDMARPRGCLTYQMTEEQLEYFHAQLAREREHQAHETKST